jgi:hypothetical protein
MYRVYRILMSKHLMTHLIGPLLVGLGVELLCDSYTGRFHGWSAFGTDKAVLVVGIVVTYLVLSNLSIYHETKEQVERSQLNALEDALPTAQSFFATSALSLKEWFDPSTQVYFSKILRRQLGAGPFTHQRVLLFFRRRELKDSQSMFLDGHYALALASVHENFSIDLGFLGPKDIRSILNRLTAEERKTLECYPRWLARWAPGFVLDLYLRSRGRIPQLDFAFITHGADAPPTVFPFSKRGESLKVEGPGSIEAYKRLMELIKQEVYEPGTNPPKLRPSHDFAAKVKTF